MEPQPCRFFAQGRCAFGSACRFSHTATPSAPAGRRVADAAVARAAVLERPCIEERIDPEDGQSRTLAELRRRYAGRYSLAEIDDYWESECQPVETEAVEALGGQLLELKLAGAPQAREAHAQGRARGDPHVSSDREHTECGICFEDVKGKNERFGMLESCDHAFCLSCIRSWRRERERQDRNNLRLCPVCRNESFFVIPSDKLVLDAEEKRLAISKYKQEMSRIPCKLFDYGRGSCPFGTSCFYAHLNPDGTRHVPAPLRWVAGRDGTEVMSAVTLSGFFS